MQWGHAPTSGRYPLPLAGDESDEEETAQVNRKVLLWLSAAAVLAVLVAYQTLGSTSAKHAEVAARADVPTVAPGTDVLAGIAVAPLRVHRYDYRRAAYGDSWDDDNDAP